MAIVQISRITNRKGLQENLPDPLASAEFGWCIDSRRLYIGNGSLDEGAPTIGNTEILTEFSDITVLSRYTYSDDVVGYAAQTGPTVGDPVVRTVQAKLDDFADIRDFGAKGDGTTDDTAAINRALYQLYCRGVDTNEPTMVRRTLYFPAGTYRVTSTINIPSYAKLVGEGANCSVISFNAQQWYTTVSYVSGTLVYNSGLYYRALLDVPAGTSLSNGTYWASDSLPSSVAQYVDNLGQAYPATGLNGATLPCNIEISSLTFQAVNTLDIMQVVQASQCYFDSVNFIGPLSVQDITNNLATDDIAAVRFISSIGYPCKQITFDKCRFSGLTYASYTNAQLNGVTWSNNSFDVLYQGLVMGDATPCSATGVRAVHNLFNNIYSSGVYFDQVSLNITAHNIFYDVGNDMLGVGNPSVPIIYFGNDNNVSMADMFERTDSEASIAMRVYIAGGAVDTSSQIQIGRYARIIGRTFTLNQNAVNTTIFSVNPDDITAFRFDYTINRGTAVRHGTMIVTAANTDDSSLTLSYTEDYTENTLTGIILNAYQSVPTGPVQVRYSSTAGDPATLTYSIAHLA